MTLFTPTVYACADCGSFDIESIAWIRLKSERIGARRAAPGIPPGAHPVSRSSTAEYRGTPAASSRQLPHV